MKSHGDRKSGTLPLKISIIINDLPETAFLFWERHLGNSSEAAFPLAVRYAPGLRSLCDSALSAVWQAS
jgi:hypothetical protein